MLTSVLIWSLMVHRRRLEAARAALAEAEKAKAAEAEAHAERMAALQKEADRLRAEIEQLAQTAADVAKAKEAAEAANRAKTQFLAMMSHELRTPLNAILGFSEIIRSEAMGPIGAEDYKEFAKDIYSSGAHLLSLINDLLDLAKVESGVVDLRDEPLDAARLVDDCVRVVAGANAARGVKLKSAPANDLPKLIADKRKLRQIMLNVLSNAAKFTPEGKSVTARVYLGPDSGMVFEVVDEGIGIAEPDIARVLEPFVQIDSDLNRAQEGTGLGLPLAKQLIELHGGQLEIESVLGQGTTVRVRLPAERSRPSDSKAAA